MNDRFLSLIDEKKALLDEISDYLWDHPETAFTETASAARLCAALREEGFAVKENLAGIPTAFPDPTAAAAGHRLSRGI